MFLKNRHTAARGQLLAAGTIIAVMLSACGNASAAADPATGQQPTDDKTAWLMSQIEKSTAQNTPAASGESGKTPVINSRKHDMIFVSDPSRIDTNDIVDYTDDGECTVTVWGYNKEEDARKLPDDVTVSLAEALLTRYDDAALTSRSKEESAPTAEGIYTAVCSVTDTLGNEAHTPIVVVIDTTPAYSNDIDQMRQQVNSNEELEGRLQNIHVVDNVDGDIPVERIGHEIIMPNGGGSYQLVLSYTDRAGNKMEQTVDLTVSASFTLPTPAQPATDDQAQAQETQQEQEVEQAQPAEQVADQSTVSDTSQPTNTTASSGPTVNVPAGAGYRNDYSDQVLALMNEQRTTAGLPPLVMNAAVQQAAGVRANELVSTFSHSRPDGSSCYTVLDQAGASYGAAGENIAAGQTSSTAVMNSWMNSVGHRDNILNANYTQVGIACYYDPSSPYMYYWVQLFIG